jgi:hypothetical protein
VLSKNIHFGNIREFRLHTFDRYFTLPPPREEHAATPDTPLVEHAVVRGVRDDQADR